MTADPLYSLENARKFSWASVTRELHPERTSHLRRFLVGNKLLDAGCGGGAYTEFLAAEGYSVTGCDNNEEFLAFARENATRGTYVRGDITFLPFPDNSFDCTYCFDVLEHVDDRLAIQQLARVTRNRLIIAVPKEDETVRNFNLTFLHYRDRTHLRNYTEKSFRELVETVAPGRCIIFPELPINAVGLFQDLIDWQSTNHKLVPILRPVFERLLHYVTYKPVFTGLVAVVDL